MSVSPLRIQMLGGFTIRRGDQEIAINDRSRKLCLLLAYLIQAQGRPRFRSLPGGFVPAADEGSAPAGAAGRGRTVL